MSSANETPSAPTRPRKEEKLFLIIVLALAAVAGIGSWFIAAALAHRDQVHGILPDRPRRLIDFSLTDSGGGTVTRADLEGKILVVSFLFTSCSLTCPEVSRRMAEIQRLTTGESDVRLLSLTVDPRTDTPPELARWGAQFDVNTNHWLLLTGNEKAVHSLIGDSFLKTDADNPFNSMPGNFTGTENIAVVDKHGRTRLFFDGLNDQTPAAVVKEINRLRAEK